MEEQQRNLLIAIVLSIAVIIGTQVLFDQPDPGPSSGNIETVQGKPGGDQDADSSLRDALGSGNSTLNSNMSNLVAPAKAVSTAGERVTFETSSMKGAFNTMGARLDEVVLPHYRETLEDGAPPIKLLQPYTTEHPYFVDYGWNLINSGARRKISPQTIWTLESKTDESVTMTTELDGLLYRNTYSYGDDEYLVDVSQQISNLSDQSVEVRPYGRVVRFGEQEVSGFFILHEGMIGYFSEDHLEEITYDDLGEADKKTLGYDSRGGWAGFTDKYWLVALLPDQESQLDFVFNQGKSQGRQFNQSIMQAEASALEPGQSRTYATHLFAGAKKVNLLDAYGERFSVPNFDKAVDFGWFYFLTKPFFKALSFIHGLVGNFGVAILILTLFIKILLFPLANASYRSMSKMKLLQPKIVELRARYAEDKAKLQQETMRFYKEEGVNPLGGCLPVIVQIPIFFSLYKVLFVTIEMRHAPFFGWIEDLSAKDPTSIFNLFGLLPFDPNTGFPALFSVLSIGIWPIIMGVTMWLQQRLNPPPADPIQAKVMMFLPVIFTFILAPFPAGLVIYWSWNNLLSVVQQWWIMRHTKLSAGRGSKTENGQK